MNLRPLARRLASGQRGSVLFLLKDKTFRSLLSIIKTYKWYYVGAVGSQLLLTAAALLSPIQVVDYSIWHRMYLEILLVISFLYLCSSLSLSSYSRLLITGSVQHLMNRSSTRCGAIFSIIFNVFPYPFMNIITAPIPSMLCIMSWKSRRTLSFLMYNG